MKSLILNFLGAIIFSGATYFYYVSPMHGVDLQVDEGKIVTLEIPRQNNPTDDVIQTDSVRFKKNIYWKNIDFISRIFLYFNVNWLFLRDGGCALWAIQKFTGHDIEDIVAGLEGVRARFEFPLSLSLKYASGTSSALSGGYLRSHGYDIASYEATTPELPNSLSELLDDFDNSYVTIAAYDGPGHAFAIIDGVVYDSSDYFIKNITFPGDLAPKRYFIHSIHFID